MPDFPLAGPRRGQDLDVGVKRRGELADWTGRDPIQRAGDALARRGLTGLERRQAEIEAEIERAVDSARRAPYPGPERVLEHVWQERIKGQIACAS